MLDQTPGVVLVLSRDQVAKNWTRDYKLRVPAADVGPGTQPYVDAAVAADAVMPLYNDAVTIGRGTTLRTSAGSWLLIIGEDDGVEPRPAVGASGFVGVTTSAGGSYIQQGTLVKTTTTQKQYQVTTSALYTTQTPVPVIGIDTGPTTNAPVGTTMFFPAPPPGLSPNAQVVADSNGNGLIGGRDADNDATYRALIAERRANPPASGNDAAYQETIQATPGISIEQVFTYPCIIGPGTTAFVFTLNPAQPGGARLPDAAQVAAALAYVIGQMPGDDGIFACALVASPVRVSFQVTWSAAAKGFADVTPWPVFVRASPVVVAAAPAPTFTSFRLTTTVTTTNPQVGQNLGFYDVTSGTYKRIRIGAVSTVAAGKTWDITPDRSYGASDPSYIPVAGAVPSPWSDSLNLVAPAVISYFDGLGPGEQVSPIPDPGTRQRRQPQSPTSWPNILDGRITIPIFALSAIETVVPLEPAFPYATPTGTPAVLSYLLQLGDLGLYAATQ